LGSSPSSVRKTLLDSVPPKKRRSVNLPSMRRPTESAPSKAVLISDSILPARTGCAATQRDDPHPRQAGKNQQGRPENPRPRPLIQPGISCIFLRGLWKNILQGLRPRCLCALHGTTKVVPFQNRISVGSSSARTRKRTVCPSAFDAGLSSGGNSVWLLLQDHLIA